MKPTKNPKPPPQPSDASTKNTRSSSSNSNNNNNTRRPPTITTTSATTTTSPSTATTTTTMDQIVPPPMSMMGPSSSSSSSSSILLLRFMDDWLPITTSTTTKQSTSVLDDDDETRTTTTGRTNHSDPRLLPHHQQHHQRRMNSHQVWMDDPQQQPSPHPLYTILFPPIVVNSSTNSTLTTTTAVSSKPTRQSRTSRMAAATATVPSDEEMDEMHHPPSDPMEIVELTTTTPLAVTTTTTTTTKKTKPKKTKNTLDPISTSSSIQHKKKIQKTTKKTAVAVVMGSESKTTTNHSNQDNEEEEEKIDNAPLDVYWLYLSIHCLHTLLEQWESLSSVLQKVPDLNTKKASKKPSHPTKKSHVTTTTPSSTRPHPDSIIENVQKPYNNNDNDTTSSLAIIMIWFSYTITTQLVSQYWYDHHEDDDNNKNDPMDGSRRRTPTNMDVDTMDYCNVNQTSDDVMIDDMVTTTTTSPISSHPKTKSRLPKISQLGKHLIGQLLILVSQVTTTALTVITTKTTTTTDHSTVDPNIEMHHSSFDRWTIFAAITVLDYVTNETNGHPNNMTTTNSTKSSSSSPSSSPIISKKDSTTIQQYSYWKQQLLSMSSLMASIYPSTIRPILSYHHQRVWTQGQQTSDVATNWTLINDCYNELNRRSTTTTHSQDDTATTTTFDSIHQCFVRLIQQTRQQPHSSSAMSVLYHIRLDSRISIKRWSSIALVWYRPGLEQLLLCAYNLLRNNTNSDQSVTEHHHQYTDPNAVDMTDIQWVTIVSRLCDIVHEIRQTAGKYTPPTTSMGKNKSPTGGNSGIQSTTCIGTPTGNATAGFDVYVQNLVSVLSSGVNVTTAATMATSDNSDASLHVPAVVEKGTGSKKSKKKAKADVVNNAMTPPPTESTTIATAAITTTRTNTNTTPSSPRTDICDLVMIVAYHLLQCHYQSIRSIIPSNLTYGLLVNSDDDENSVVKLNTGTVLRRNMVFNPYLTQTIGNLATTAATHFLSGNTSQSTQQRIYTERIEYMVAAWIFMIQESPRRVVDIHLSSYAITKLLTCLNMKSARSQSNTNSLSDLKYNVPLPIPTLQSQFHPSKEAIASSSSRKRKKMSTTVTVDGSTISAVESAVPAAQTPLPMFAGMYDIITAKFLKAPLKKNISSMFKAKGSSTVDYPIVHDLTSDEKLALFTRAMNCEAEKLLMHMIWIAESCCHKAFDLKAVLDHTRTETVPVDSTVEPQKKKRKNVDGSTKLRNKKQKRVVEDVTDNDAAELSQTPILLNDHIAKVLTGVFNVLRSVLRNDSTAVSHVQTALRCCVTASTNHLFRMLELGKMIEDALLFLWSADTPSSSLSSNLDKDNKALWSAVMNFYVIVGKTYAVAPADSKNDIRLDLYKKIAQLSTVRSSTNTAWPLWLGPSSRLLISTTLLSTSPSNSADSYIVNGIIVELQHVAATVQLKLSSEISSARKIVPEVPLSLYDARIFLVAFSRLSKVDQTSYFVDLLLITEALIQASNENVTIQNKATLSLVGRLVTLCSNTYCMMKLGASMRDKLVTVLENTMTILSWPPDRSMYPDVDPSCLRYMGVFDDWEHSELPLLAVPAILPELGGESVDIESMLEKALKLGFLSAPIDSCHILFAAWNELGKRDLWAPMTTHISAFTSLTNDLTSTLIQLREEMCYVHWTIKKYHNEIIADSTLIRVLEKRNGGIRNCESSVYIKGLLRSMIDKSTKMMDAIVDSFQHDETGMAVCRDPVKFCLLEACTVYTSFAISSFTRPSSDFFTLTHSSLQARSLRRSRGYSTDSDALQQSDAGSDDSHDLLFAAIGRIHDVCDCIGAAPAHPDWLDDECHLFVSMSSSETAEIALKALSCLTKVIRSGLTNTQLGIKCALGKLQKGSESVLGDSVTLAGTLSLLKHTSVDHFAPATDARFSSLIGTVCGLDSSCLHSILSLRKKGRLAPSTETNWYPHSSHRIQGKLQAGFRSEVIRELNCEELKLCGEWEIMLASRLSSASIETIPSGESDHNTKEYLAVSEHWLVVCEAVLASLVPTAALLRFCVHLSGRHPHPLSFIDSTVEGFEIENCCTLSIEDSNLGITQSSLYHETITSALVALSYFPSYRASVTIASQLIMEPTAFYALQGLVRYAHALQAINGLQEALVFGNNELFSIVPVLIEQAALTLKQWGLGTRIANDYLLGKSSSCLVSCLLGHDYKNKLRFKSILLEDVDPIKALSQHSSESFLKWDWPALHVHSIKCLLLLVFDDTLESLLETRGILAFAMARVITTCFASGVLPVNVVELKNVFMDTLNKIPVKSLEKVVREYVCGVRVVDGIDENSNFGISSLRESLCTLLAFALQSNATTNTFVQAPIVCEILMKNLEMGKVFDDCVLDVTMLYATYFTKLDTVASMVLNDECSTRNDDKSNVTELKLIHKFVTFVDTFSPRPHEWMRSETKSMVLKNGNKSVLNNLPICCSYVLDKDFHGQHWYNCYTCGLINDKGCCTLCAIVCHQGHDIVYARFSSFFCDCGGGEDHGIVQCKCLSEQARDCYLTKSSKNGKRQKWKPYQLLSTEACGSIINTSFPSIGIAAVKKLSLEGGRTWLSRMSERSKAHFLAWKANDDDTYRILNEKGGKGCYGENNILDSDSKEYLRIRTRHFTVNDDFSYFGESQTGMLSGRVCATTLLDRSNLPGKVAANVMDADSRGRVAVVDSNRVIFFSGLSMLNSRCDEKQEGNPSMNPSLISSVSFGFVAKGLKFIPDFENSIYVWGTERAKIVQMTSNVTTIAKEINLAITYTHDRGSNEIINCRWIVGSGTFIVVGCSHQLLIFDISQQGSSIEPILSLSSLTDDSSLLDFVVIRVTGKGERGVRHWKVFANLENGKTRTTTILQDEDGFISEGEVSECLDDAIMEGSGNDVDDIVVNGSFSGSRKLHFLEKSSILLCETKVPNILALFLTENGTVSNVVRLLPFSFSLDSSITGVTGTVHGPFKFWNEMESIRRGNDDFFRVVCIGHLEKSNTEVLISVEFNKDGVSAHNLEWRPPMQQSSTQSYMGLATFTAPIQTTEYLSSSIQQETRFKEHTVVCALNEAGCFKVFLDMAGSLTIPILKSLCYSDTDDSTFYVESDPVSMKDFELSLKVISIEDYKNVTDSNEVIFGGCDELGTSANIKQMLRSGSSDYLRSPRSAGCMITVSVVSKQYNDSLQDIKDRLHFTETADSVVTAVRIRLGPTQKTIPRSIKIMGKSYQIVPSTRRWYNFFLSAQDIAYSVRNGFVAIEIGQCHDSTSHPTIDAVEIYALERWKIQKWLPIAIHSVYPAVADVQVTLSGSSHESFRLCIEAWATSHRIFGNSSSNDSEYALLQQLVADAALIGDKQIFESVMFMLSSFEPDEEARQRSIDNGILSGCSSFLLKMQTLLQTTTNADVSTCVNWMQLSLMPAIRSCLRTAASVALLRPFNYPQVVENSIATMAVNIVSACLKFSVSAELVEDVVELSLLESTVVNVTPLGRFGSFDGIRRLLLKSNKRIASKIYESITRFCKFGDIFTAQTVAVKYVCDSCLLFINDTRYTVVEEEHGLDLCPKCYFHATEYAENKNKNEAVKINGKNVGELHSLTCEEVSAMEPVPIQKHTATSSDSALNAQYDETSETDGAHQNQLFNDFMDGLTTGIAGHLVEELKKSLDIPSSLIDLSVDLIRHSIHSGRKVDRGKELLSSMIVGLHARLLADSSRHRIADCSYLLEGLINTFVQDKCVRNYFQSTEGFTKVCPMSDDDKNLKHVCSVHNLPLCCYKISDGPEKNRIFMVCSKKEPRDRCNFFMWADKRGYPHMDERSGLFDEEIGKLVWQCLSDISSGEGNTTHLRLCSLIEELTLPPSAQKSSTNSEKSLRYNFNDLQQRFYDGVFCCHGILKNNLFLKDQLDLFHNSQNSKSDVDSTTANSALVQKALELMSLIATMGGQSDNNWFPVLCRLSSSDKGQLTVSQRIRHLARRSLLKLCGNDTTIAAAIRDHYGFACQIEKVVRESKQLLDICLIINDKARVCSPHRKFETQHSFKGFKVRHVVGIEELVSEDLSTLEANRAITGVLKEIMQLAEKRCGSWRRFCGLQQLPEKVSLSTVTLHDQLLNGPPINVLLALICSSSIENQSLVLRVVRLALGRSSDRKCAPLHANVNVCNTPDDAKMINLPQLYQNCMNPETILNVSIDDLYAFVLGFVYRGSSYDIQKEALSIAKRLWSCIDKRSQAVLLHQLLSGPLYSVGNMGKRSTCLLIFLQSAISTIDVGEFNIRQAITNVQSCFQGQRLATSHDKANGEFFHIETKSDSSTKLKRYDLGVCSHCHTYFSRVKVQRAGKPTSTGNQGISALAALPTDTVTWLPGQLSSFSRMTLDMGSKSTATSEFCSFVALKHRSFVSAIHIQVESPRRYVKKIKFYFSPRPVDQISVLKSEQYSTYWQQCGVVSLSRDSTRTSYTLPTPVIAANLKIEYAEFHEKATSTKASDGSIIVNCPRCRRVVSNAHGVCASCGEVAFQCRKCRHINYERLDAFLCVECGYCASASFRYDLTAAVATNAVAIMNDKDYMVALNRMRVASQLREELQSTLKWKLRGLTTQHGAKNLGARSAIDSNMEGFLPFRKAFADVESAINTDEKYIDTKTILSKLGSSGAMIKMIANAVNYENMTSSAPTISLFQSTAESRLDRASSTSRVTLTSSGSLLRDIARDALNISGEDSQDDASATALASELFSGLFDSSGGDSSFTRYTYRLDVNNQLRRLLANAQSRRLEVVDESTRNRSDSAATTSTAGDDVPATSNTSQGTKTAPSSSTTTKSITPKEDMAMCDKLYHRICEVECEMYELNRRCASWRRLNSGCVYPSAAPGSNDESTMGALTFEPSHCSSCGPLILVHFLILWLILFQRDPSSAVVTADMIVYLFDTDPSLMAQQQHFKSGMSTYQQLQDTKHMVIQEIALRSKQGSKLVLEALRLRLLTLLQDQNAVDILGLILEAFAKVNVTAGDSTIDGSEAAAAADINSVQPFVELAHEALQGNISIP